MQLRSVNLNLIPVLQALLRERSVAATAAALDMSPAAASEALGRLRVLLDDPLLVRVGRGMRLTPKAAELIDPVNRLCDEAEGLLQNVEGFDPRTSKRHFRVATNDCLVYLTAQRILQALHSAAPSVQVHFSDPRPDVGEQMTAREIDCLLMPRFFMDAMTTAMPMRSRTLFRDRLVVAFSARHPLARSPKPTAEDLAAYPQILYNPTTVNAEGRLEREVMGDVAFNVAMRVSQVSLIPPLLAEPPFVSWLPLSLVDRVRERLQLVSRDAPLAMPNLDVFLAWSPVHHLDAGHRWFRELLVDVLGPA